MIKFRDELSALINKYSKENGSNTPDFILAGFLTDCLSAFDKATRVRTAWYDNDMENFDREANSKYQT
jgi:hypothetical protein